MRLLIAGCGDLGRRLGLRWQEAGGSVLALRRHVDGLPDRFSPLSIDLSKPIARGAIPGRIDAVAFVASADRRDEAAYRAIYVDGQQHLLDALAASGRHPPPHWLFVSSTAVYGENEGGWVDEQSLTAPDAFNGRLLLDAERRLIERLPDACCARLAGIYGPGRESLLRRAANGDVASARWSNRIHIDDAASALDHLLRLPQRPQRICISDDAPTPEHEVLATLREMLGMAPVDEKVDAELPLRGRRVNNRSLHALGVRLAFPDYRAGYAAILARRQPASALI